MASGNNDTTIKLGLEADLSGGAQTEKQLEAVRNKAKQLEKDGTASVGKVTGAVGGLHKACGLLRNILTGFGVVGVFTALAAAVGKVKDSFGAAKKEAEELEKAKTKAAHKEAVEALAKSYETLGEAMRKAGEAMQRANELEDIATKNARALEDAQLDLAEQKELAAVDANDPEAAEKRAAISARYAERRGGLTAQRSREDLASEQNRLMAQAGAKRNDAARIDDLAKDYDKQIAEVMSRILNAKLRSTEFNEKDAGNGFWSTLGVSVKRFVSLDWGQLTNPKTEEGDAIRKDAAAEAEKLEAELKQLEGQREAKRKQAAALRAEAEHMDERAGAIGGMYAAIDARETATAISGSRSVKDADTALGKKVAKREKDEKTVAEGKETLANFAQTEEEQRAKAQAAADKYQKEQGDVFAAQNRYDALVQNGGSKKEKSAALAALQKEKDEALEAQHEMEKVAAEVANVLKAIKEEVGTLSRSVTAAQSRLKQNEADAPEG